MAAARKGKVRGGVRRRLDAAPRAAGPHAARRPQVDGIPGALLRLLFDRLLELVVLHELVRDRSGRPADYRILDCNPAFTRITGIPREKARGALASELYGTDPAPYLDTYARVAESGEPTVFETYFPPMDKHFLISVVAPGRDLFATLATEITERARAERALDAERERLAVTLRSIGDGVIATDTAGRVVTVNRAAEALTGWRAEEAIGRPLGEVLRIVDPATREPCPDPFRRVLESGSAISLPKQTLLLARDGEERSIADSAAPIRDPENRVVGAVLTFRDVTAEERREQALARAQRLESLALLSGGIAHDFNNLLTGILANLSVARADGAAGHLAETLADAESAARRARGLTQQLLTFSRGGQPVRRIADPAPVVRDAARFAALGAPAACRLELDGALWAAEIDAGQIGQVVQNLVLNAVQAMPEGGSVTVSAENAWLAPENAHALRPGPYLRLRVRDTGPGIPAEILGRIFEPFFTTTVGGSGLGLSVCHSIVEKHGGRIAVESRPGEGTTFELHLPALPGASVQGGRRGDDARTAQGRVLVMDDEPGIRRAAERILRQIGCRPVAVADGREAVRAATEAREAGDPFAAVILDLTVPGGMGGLEALRAIRAVDPALPAIVSSGYSTDPVLSNHRQHGFAGVILKPFDAADLQEALLAILGRPAAAR